MKGNKLYAFPVGIADDGKHGGWLNEGMELRDYFAAKAMQVVMGSNLSATKINVQSEWAYKIADAMLKARG